MIPCGNAGNSGPGSNVGILLRTCSPRLPIPPIRRTWWHLNQIRLRHIVPCDSPAHRPAVAGAHCASVHQVDPAIRHLATIHQQASGPALVWLHVSVAVEDAIQYNVGSLLRWADSDVEDVVAGRATAVEQDLRPIGGEVRGFGRALYRNTLRDIDTFHGNSPGILADADRFRCVEDTEIAHPAIFDACHLQAIEVLVIERDLPQHNTRRSAGCRFSDSD